MKINILLFPLFVLMLNTCNVNNTDNEIKLLSPTCVEIPQPSIIRFTNPHCRKYPNGQSNQTNQNNFSLPDQFEPGEYKLVERKTMECVISSCIIDQFLKSKTTNKKF